MRRPDDSEEPLLRDLLDQDEAVQDVLARYQRVRNDLGREHRPLPLVLAPRGQGVSFAAAWPHMLTQPGTADLGLLEGSTVHLLGSAIRDLKDGKSLGTETVCHEVGHAIMIETHGLEYPIVLPESVGMFLLQEGHWLGKETDADFAFSEGWAEYLGWSCTDQDSGTRYLRKPLGGWLSAGEVRVREASVASVFTVLDRANLYEDPRGQFIEVLRDYRPRTLDAFLDALARAQPNRALAMKAELASVTGGVYPLAGPVPLADDAARMVDRLHARAAPVVAEEVRHKAAWAASEIWKLAEAVLDNLFGWLRGAPATVPAKASKESSGNSHGTWAAPLDAGAR